MRFALEILPCHPVYTEQAPPSSSPAVAIPTVTARLVVASGRRRSPLIEPLSLTDEAAQR